MMNLCSDCIFKQEFRDCVYVKHLKDNECSKFIPLYCDDSETDIHEAMGYGMGCGLESEE